MGVLVAQGFTGIENKGDELIFHSFPHTVPHTRNKDCLSDSSGTF
ncbi:hypothetical protein AciX8_3600 [Granulicella mallensis MP5ACTX8]|uniref:Uncharacterized protein n=1 Tax=Granulicella mallensis (strain ATCC BAA-1857 / DSM 23137 / MP5ACTX8) TaxID=682795 RepID=G8NYC5_GRAMM|nr:hypothetical protein AciX8_3600 [Granulicella mallensis MP5ACTX8]